MMKSRNHKLLCLAAALALANAAIVGDGGSARTPDTPAGALSTLEAAEAIVGGQMHEWMVCGAMIIGTMIYPVLHVFAEQACQWAMFVQLVAGLGDAS